MTQAMNRLKTLSEPNSAIPPESPGLQPLDTFGGAGSREGGELSFSVVEPFNLRLTQQPLRCLTGVTIPPGLVGFCWETPLSLEVLSQQAPVLAEVARRWIETGGIDIGGEPQRGCRG